jgi:hypothetical protein
MFLARYRGWLRAFESGRQNAHRIDREGGRDYLPLASQVYNVGIHASRDLDVYTNIHARKRVETAEITEQQSVQ